MLVWQWWWWGQAGDEYSGSVTNGGKKLYSSPDMFTHTQRDTQHPAPRHEAVTTKSCASPPRYFSLSFFHHLISQNHCWLWITFGWHFGLRKYYSIKPDLPKRGGPMLMSGVNERLKKQSPKSSVQKRWVWCAGSRGVWAVGLYLAGVWLCSV